MSPNLKSTSAPNTAPIKIKDILILTKNQIKSSSSDLTPDAREEESKDIDLQLFKEQLKEQKQRRRFRLGLLIFFSLLLIIQHGALIVLVARAIQHDYLKSIQTLMAVAIPATLGETFLVFKEMVKFCFKDGNFESRRHQKSGLLD